EERERAQVDDSLSASQAMLGFRSQLGDSITVTVPELMKIKDGFGIVVYFSTSSQSVNRATAQVKYPGGRMIDVLLSKQLIHFLRHLENGGRIGFLAAQTSNPSGIDDDIEIVTTNLRIKP